MDYVRIQSRRIEYELDRAGPAAPVIVFLHEGLGSLSAWRDFPARIARATRCGTLVYSKWGHGASDPPPAARGVDYMHVEALETLPALLDALGVERPVLLGHSEGASIALIHAGGSGRAVAGVVAMAPHVMVEEANLAAIRQARVSFETTDLRERLARHHNDAEATFRGWNGIWLDPAFRAWNIEEYLPRVACPVLAIRGEQDEYGTMLQVERIAQAVPDVRALKVARCGHSPHRDQPEVVIEAVAGFVGGLAPYVPGR
jgi:pimeloyl-ACP methyl ester carboxylesterase